MLPAGTSWSTTVKLTEAVQMPRHDGSKATQGIVRRGENGEHACTLVQLVDPEPHPGLAFGHLREVHQVHGVAGGSRTGTTAVLTHLQRATARGPPRQGHVLHPEGEGAACGEERQLAVDAVGRIVQEDGVDDVMEAAVREVLRGLPVQGVRIVDADEVPVLHVSQGVGTDQHVVPLKAVFDDVRRAHAVVPHRPT